MRRSCTARSTRGPTPRGSSAGHRATPCAGPRRGADPGWGTVSCNLSRDEVRNVLLANGPYWLKERHADGLGVDAVASGRYPDYSRDNGEWLPNEDGGGENLEAVAFLKRMN